MYISNLICCLKKKEINNKQCMNALLSRIRYSSFNKTIMEYLISLKTEILNNFKYSQAISLHTSMWRFGRKNVPTIWLVSKYLPLTKFAEQATLEDKLVDSFYQKRCFISSLFFTYK